MTGEVENPFMEQAARVLRHAVWFAREQTDDGLISGSGTLVRHGRLQGIASCAHVIHEITATSGRSRDDKIAIVRSTTPDALAQRPVVGRAELANCPLIICGKHNERIEGPDLAFLCLSNKMMSDLGASNFALDLGEQRAQFGAPPPDGCTDMLHVAVGSVADWKEETEQTAVGAVVTGATLVLPGRYSEEPASGIADRFRFEPDAMTRYPATYASMSGSSLWRSYFNANTAHVPELVQQRLMGVVYYQVAVSGEETPFHLVGHGPASVYDWLLPQMVELAAQLERRDDASDWLIPTG